MTCTTQVTGSTTRRDGIESFVSGIRGAVLRPEDPGYIDRRLMLRCMSPRVADCVEKVFSG